MEHIVTRRSVLAVPFMLLVAMIAMGAVVSRSSPTQAAGIQCNLPKDAVADRLIAQVGKARLAVSEPELVLPVGTTRNHANHTGAIAPPSPIRYVRCVTNQA